MQNTLTHEIIILHIAYLQIYVVPKVFFFSFSRRSSATTISIIILAIASPHHRACMTLFSWQYLKRELACYVIVLVK